MNVLKNGVSETLTQAEIDAKTADWAASETNMYNLAMQVLRSKRNKLLADTDYWDNSDTPAMTLAQTTYRQDLRDITNGLSTTADVNAVVWPTKP